MMKQFILYTIFCNVLLIPWGLSHEGTAIGVAGSVAALMLKFLVVACCRGRGRDRAIAAALLPLSGIARGVVRLRHPRHHRNATGVTMLVAHLDPLASSIFSLMAIVSLLLAFVMLGSRWLNNYLYAFAAESWVIAALSAAVGFYGGYPELY